MTHRTFTPSLPTGRGTVPVPRRPSVLLAIGIGLLLVLHMPTVAVATTVLPPGSPESGIPGRSVELTCPPGEVAPAGFADVSADNVHNPSIDCLRHRGMTEGVGDNRYLPAGLVNRAQMATFVARLIDESGGELTADPPDAFADDDDSVHEANINKLAAAGVVTGTGVSTFEPHGNVTRAQMASLMVRAVEHRLNLVLAAPESDSFADDNGNVHEASINKSSWARVVVGLGDGRYDPNGVVVRDQVASFAIRALDLVVSRPSWERAVELVHACQVESAVQSHNLRLSLGLKDGTSHHTTQPHGNAVFDEVAVANCPGPPPTLGTE